MKRDKLLNPDGTRRVYGPEYQRVSSMDCCICGARGWWAHHVRSVGRGGEDAGNLVPFCMKHHNEGHVGGWLTFEQKYHVSLVDVAKETARE